MYPFMDGEPVKVYKEPYQLQVQASRSSLHAMLSRFH